MIFGEETPYHKHKIGNTAPPSPPSSLGLRFTRQKNTIKHFKDV